MDWNLVISIASLLATLILAIYVMRRGENMAAIAALKLQIEGLQAGLEKKTGDLVEAKFAIVAAELKTPITELSTIVKGVLDRLENGDEEFGQLGDRGQKLELKTQQELASIRMWAMQEFASKADLRHAVTALQKLEVVLAKAGHLNTSPN